MNDLELIDAFVEHNCKTGFVNPLLFRDIEGRGLAWIVNYLPSNTQEAKAVVRGRLAKIGRFFGEPEIDQIANEIKRLEFLRKKLNEANMADAHKTGPILEEMVQINNFLLNYYKS